VTAERDAEQIRAEIEQARDQLAETVDQLADRLAPQRLADRAKAAIIEKATSPAGLAVIGGTVLLVTVLAVRNLRRSRR
jgi:hypothetical protein